MKAFLVTLCLISLAIASCGSSPLTPSSSPIVPKTETSTPIVTFSPFPTEKISPTQLPTIPPTVTPQAIHDSGFIALLGKQNSSLLGSSLVFSPDGLIIVQADTNVKLWDASTHKMIRELKYPDYGIPNATNHATKALFSPDGSLIAVSITDYLTHLGEPHGHLLVWVVATGELKQNWEQKYATMSAYDGYTSDPRIYNIPVDAMAFFPSSTKLAYANGNRIEIKDARTGEEFTGWSLGDTMYASEISIRDDSEFLYVLMRWHKDLTFPALYRYKFKAQIWYPATESLRREIKFEEVYPGIADVWLVGQYLLHQETTKSALEALDLSTDQRRDFPYRIGVKYFNTNASLMLCLRYINRDEIDIEIWNTDTWRDIHSFKTTFSYDVNSVAFSPDNSLLAIDYHGQVYLWSIHTTIQPQ